MALQRHWSGFNHSFDFVTGSSRDRPERYLRAISTPSRENVVELVFAWQDLRDVRPRNALAYAVLNDQERPTGQSLLDALDKYQMGIITWSGREAQVAALRNNTHWVQPTLPRPRGTPTIRAGIGHQT